MQAAAAAPQGWLGLDRLRPVVRFLPSLRSYVGVRHFKVPRTSDYRKNEYEARYTRSICLRKQTSILALNGEAIQASPWLHREQGSALIDPIVPEKATSAWVVFLSCSLA